LNNFVTVILSEKALELFECVFGGGVGKEKRIVCVCRAYALQLKERKKYGRIKWNLRSQILSHRSCYIVELSPNA
jgi:hypothetical protein